MTEAKHTLGPWSFDHDWTRIPTIFGLDGRQMIATVEKHKRLETNPGLQEGLPEREANARLIAAAPEMLEALRGLIAVADADENQDLWTGEYRSAVEAGTEALAKATGAA